MQNWKIKRMSGKRINLWLEAIKELIGDYKTRTWVKWCPFCELVEYCNCDNCMWYIIESTPCTQFAEKLGFNSAITARNKKKWRKARIPMLRRWKKILQQEKDRRTEGGG